MKLRDYQQAASDGCFAAWEECRSTLVTMPTGTGKTVLFAHVIKRAQELGWGRVMVVAHREELIDQAAATLNAVLGERSTDIEMGQRWADQADFWRAPVVVTSVQTQTASRGGRMQRFDPKKFGLLIIDEAHHAVADSYRQLIDYYLKGNPDLKLLGVTATPDRADEEAMGQVFDSVAFDYEITDAIRDGWLVDVHQDFVQVVGLDFSRCRTTAGDLNQGDLAEIMQAEKNLHAIAGPTLEIANGRKTLIFTVSVLHAELLCAILNRMKPDCAKWISGETPTEDRRAIINAYRRGEFQVMCNCMIATEGFDVPDISVVAIGRPTKSRALYAQMLGRGTRPLKGLVDGIEPASNRKLAIAASSKPEVHIIDFVGNSGKHKLICSTDILGEDADDEVLDRANKIIAAANGGMGTTDAIEEAERQIAEEAEQQQSEMVARSEQAGFVAKTTYFREKVDPFGIFDLRPMRERGWDKIRPVTQKQLAVLDKAGVDYKHLNATERKEAVQAVFKRMNEHKCSLKQAKVLKKYMPVEKVREVGFKDASMMIDAIARTGWKSLPANWKDGSRTDRKNVNEMAGA